MLDTLCRMMPVEPYVEYDDRPEGYQRPEWAYVRLERGGFVVFHEDRPLCYVVGMTVAAPLFFRWPGDDGIPEALLPVAREWVRRNMVPRLAAMHWEVGDLDVTDDSKLQLSVEFRCGHPMVLVDLLAYLDSRVDTVLSPGEITALQQNSRGGPC